MRVEVRPMNVKGKPLKNSEMKAVSPCRGDLRVFENRLHYLGRAATCARVVSASDGLETDVMPELTDASLLWLDAKVIRLRGVEVVEGTHYSQTWDIKII